MDGYPMQLSVGNSGSRSNWLARLSRTAGGVLSATLSILGAGIFLWGSTLAKPSLQGVLLCLGPVISFPMFLLTFRFRKLQRFTMWLDTALSIMGSFIATLLATTSGRSASRSDLADAMHSLLLPGVLLSVFVAIFVELSYQIASSREV